MDSPRPLEELTLEFDIQMRGTPAQRAELARREAAQIEHHRQFNEICQVMPFLDTKLQELGASYYRDRTRPRAMLIPVEYFEDSPGFLGKVINAAGRYGLKIVNNGDGFVSISRTNVHIH
jgi:hypothetical protein